MDLNRHVVVQHGQTPSHPLPYSSAERLPLTVQSVYVKSTLAHTTGALISRNLMRSRAISQHESVCSSRPSSMHSQAERSTTVKWNRGPDGRTVRNIHAHDQRSTRAAHFGRAWPYNSLAAQLPQLPRGADGDHAKDSEVVALRATHASHHEPCCSQSNARSLPVRNLIVSCHTSAQ